MAEKESGNGPVYSIGYGPEVHRWHMRRTAENRMGFLLTSLRPGMSLLDCGCGLGSITVGLAQAVSPGCVVGIDLEQHQIEKASVLAAEKGITSVSFKQADIHSLPFADASYDVVTAHNVLEHLPDPLKAIKEMHRLIKPGGIIAVRDPDFSLLFCEPATRLLQQASNLILKVREFKGGSPYYARRLRSLLQEAGFCKTQGFAFVDYQGESREIKKFASALIEVLLNPANIDVAAAQGWADRAIIEAMAAEIQAWANKPDAFHGNLDCAAIGWKKDLVSLIQQDNFV